MIDKEIKAHLELIWDMYSELEGTILAGRLNGEIEEKELEKGMEYLGNAILLLGIKVEPWDFDTQDYQYIEKIQNKFKEKYFGVE